MNFDGKVSILLNVLEGQETPSRGRDRGGEEVKIGVLHVRERISRVRV